MSKCIISAEMVKNIIEKRRREIHKGHCGRVLILAGSKGMMGAAVLASRSALRSGAGLVQMAIPEDLFPIAQVAVPEATCLIRDLSSLDLAGFDAAAAGPGLGTGDESIRLIEELLDVYEGRLVLDADGLNIIAREKLLDKMKKRAGETIITPHMFEAKRLLSAAGYKEEDFDFRTSLYSERVRIARALAEVTGAIAVLKGAGTVVAGEGTETYINTTGNPGMATAGSGDVLTGIAAGLWGQKDSKDQFKNGLEAACAAVYVHGLAGDMAADELGEYGLIASDMVERIPGALKELLK